MIWEESELVFCRKLIISQAEVLHTKFCLNEIYERQSEVLRLCICLSTLLTGHFYGVDIVVIAINRPVDHIFPVRSPSICDHHLRGPQSLTSLRLSAILIETTVVEWSWVIPFRFFNSHISIRTIVLQQRHKREVLNHIIRLGRSDRLSCIRRRLHADFIINSASLGNITELCSINQDIRCHRIFLAF